MKPLAAASTSPVRRARSRNLLGVLAGMMLVLAACGGDDDESSSDQTTADTTEATAVATTDAGDETTAPDETDAPSTDAPDDTDAPTTDAPDATEAPSTDAPPAGDGDTYDVCALLTPEELQSLFGSPFEGSPSHQEQTGGDQCVWTNTDAPPVKLVSITVLRQDHLGGAFETADVDLAQLYEDTKTYATDPQDIDLGDKAYTTGQAIHVLLGDTYITFDISGTSDEAIAGLTGMAELVMGKIA